MRAARFHSYDEFQLHLDEVPDPTIQGPHDVLVRAGAAGVCRTDLHILEGIWKDVLNPELPYTIGHENAGWVEEVGDAVTSVAVGDTVICHPLMTCGVCPACRRGEDMYCESGTFPGLNADGGYAEYLRTSERALIKLPEGLEPKDVAPHADAGITAYRAAKKATAVLEPGTRCVVIGVGGLGHIAIQCLKALGPAEIIAVDISEPARKLAEQVGADQVVEGDEDPVEAVRRLTGDRGAEAVIDFVGEHGTTEQGPAMLARGGTYFVVGYGGVVSVPAIQIIFSEIGVVGSLVGNYTQLRELMALAGAGKVTLHTQEYPLDRANDALDDLNHGRVQGRGVLIP
ncbi:MAG: NAD(P)-dependent alcohol dehydrogenase [Acidimicrobiales bacterium]